MKTQIVGLYHGQKTPRRQEAREKAISKLSEMYNEISSKS